METLTSYKNDKFQIKYKNNFYSIIIIILKCLFIYTKKILILRHQNNLK